MAKALAVTWHAWNHAQWRDELDDAVNDYLRRSGEEITIEEEWQSLNAAMLGAAGILFVAVVDDAQEHLLGFALCRIAAGTAITGPFGQIWQAYVWPGRGVLRELFEFAWPLIEAWGDQYGVTRYVMYTRRNSSAYAKILAGVGFTEYATVYQKGG